MIKGLFRFDIYQYFTKTRIKTHNSIESFIEYFENKKKTQ
jgi:hypothetical protein